MKTLSQIGIAALLLSGASLLLVGCGKKEERAKAVKQPDPTIQQVETNEVTSIDFREKIKENREKQVARVEFEELIASIQVFQEEMGRVPSNLVELVEMQYIERIPDPPPNVEYVYKNEHGQVFEVFSDGRTLEEEKKESVDASTFLGQ